MLPALINNQIQAVYQQYCLNSTLVKLFVHRINFSPWRLQGNDKHQNSMFNMVIELSVKDYNIVIHCIHCDICDYCYSVVKIQYVYIYMYGNVFGFRILVKV